MRKRITLVRGSVTGAACIVRLVLLCLIIPLVSACSALRIGYEFVPRYAAWQLDRYWELDSAQASFSKERIDELWRWHRHSELPEYARWLRSLNGGLDASVDIVEVTNWRRMLIRYWRVTALRVAPDVSELIVSLRPQQIDHMKQRLASANEDYKQEFLPHDPAMRQARRIKRIEERLEYYFGPLMDVQRDIVRRMAGAMPRNEQVWFEERLARQKDFVDLAERLGRFGPSPTAAQREEAARLVTDYLVSLWEPRDPKRRQALESVMLASDEITVAVFNAALAEQKARLSERLLGLAADFEALSR